MNQRLLLLTIICVSFFNGFSQTADSLYAKRVFLSTHIYKDGVKLSSGEAATLYKETLQSQIKYKWSNILKPTGPFVAVGGVGLAYIALKGVDATTIIDGKTIDYKIRSLSKLLLGLGLVVSGISMIESSNELVQHSVDIYNSKLGAAKKISHIDKIKFGITESNGLGFSISLK